MEINRKFYLSLAINEAWKYQILTYPNPAVGCVVVSKNGEILAVSAHKKSGLAHAELEATKEALQKINPNFNFPKVPNKLYEFIIKNHQNFLEDSTFYVTLEPCSHEGKTPSCAKLLSNLNVKKVVIGCMDNNKTASGGIDILKKSGIEVEVGVLEKKCKELIEPFLSWQKNKFCFFKIALRMNGTYDNGTITSLKSREYVHKLRDACDLIVIGGETARKDRPILNSRLINGKAPDVLLVSEKEIDKKLPLFSVENRNVLTCKKLKFPKKYKNIMIEGGNNFLKFSQNKIDWILVFYSSDFNKIGDKIIKNDVELKLLHVSQISNDHFCWYKVLNKN